MRGLFYNVFVLYREFLVKNCAAYAATVAPIVVFVGGLVFFSRLLSDAASNAIPIYHLGHLFFLTLVKYTPQLLSLSLFFGILLALHQATLRNETVAWLSAGLSRRDFILPLLGFILPGALCVALFALYLSPWAVHQIKLAQSKISINIDVTRLPLMQFVRAPGDSHTYYHDDLGNIFIFRNDSTAREAIITQEIQSGDDPSLNLINGKLFRASASQPAAANPTVIESMSFASLRVGIPTAQVASLPPRAMPPTQLRLSDPGELAELIWRVNLVFITVFLALAALWITPARNRFGARADIICGIILFFVSLSFLRFVKDQMASDALSPLLAVTAPPLLIAVFAAAARPLAHR